MILIIYTLTQLIQNNIYRTNKYVLKYITAIIETYKKRYLLKILLKMHIIILKEIILYLNTLM